MSTATALRPAHRMSVWGLAVATVLWLAVELAWPGGPIGALDRWWASFGPPRSEAAIGLARLLDVVGGVAVSVVIRVGVALWLWMRRRIDDLWLWVGSVVAAEAVSLAAKYLYDRPRPPGSLVETVTASFPSGHTTNAAAMSVAAVIVFTRRGTLGRRVGVVLAIAYTAAMGWSRTYLQAHWVGDVIGGALIGTTAVVVVAAVLGSGVRTAPDGPQRTPDP